MDKEEYSKLVEKKTKNSPIIKNFFAAYLVGGSICVLGQGLNDLYVSVLNVGEENGAKFTSITLVFLSALFTGLGLYQKLARFAGAGTLVPITGFANAVVSPALEFKSEGYILGLGANLFKIAGPVIVYGTVASVIYGLIYWIVGMF